MPLGTITRVTAQDVGDGEILSADVVLAASYAKGGDEITAEALGFRTGTRLDSVSVDPVGNRKIRFVADAARADRGKLQVFDELGDDFLLSRPGLGIGTVSAAEVKNTNAYTKVVAGAIAEIAVSETGFSDPADDIAADADKIQEAVYLMSVQAGGTIVITKGASADEGLGVPPALPAGEALVGYVTIQVEAGATPFDATSDDLDAAHLTTTFEDADGEALEGADLSALTVRVTASGR